MKCEIHLEGLQDDYCVKLILFGSTYTATTEQYSYLAGRRFACTPAGPEVETVLASKATPSRQRYRQFVIAGSDYGGILNGAPALRKKILLTIMPKKNRTAFFTASFHR